MFLILTLSHSWGWYRCWCFHKIGWEEDKQPLPGCEPHGMIVAGVPRSGTSVSIRDVMESACDVTEAIENKLKPLEDDDEDTVEKDKG